MRKLFFGGLMILLAGTVFALTGTTLGLTLQDGTASGVSTADPALTPSSEAERKAWNRVSETTDLEKKAKSADSYLKDFPSGVYAPYAHEILAVQARRNNDLPDFFKHGELAVAQLPESLLLETSLAVAYAEQQNPEPALRHAERLMLVLPTLVASDQAEGAMTEERRQEMMGDTNYALGTAHLFRGYTNRDRQEITDAIGYLESAVRMNRVDQRSQFRLAFAYQITRQVDKAIAGYARAVALGGANSQMAQRYLEEVYRTKNGSLDGLEALIQEQKDQLAAAPL